MEWSVAYEETFHYSSDLATALVKQALQDPEVLEIKILRTHDSRPTSYGTSTRIIDAEDPDKYRLPEPKVIQHVRLRWRLGR